MATSLDTLSLSQLLDLAIGMPPSGAVHFAAMRKLMQAVLEHLDVQYLTTEEPWPGRLGGPSLADIAAEVKEIKKEMEVYKEHTGIGGVTGVSKETRKKKSKSPKAEDTKKLQEGEDEDVSVSLDLHEEVRIIKTTQNRMAQKVKELAALMKKLEDDIKKLRENVAEWKEESREEFSQQLEAVLQETKQELQKVEEQQEMRNTMLQELVTETANQLNGQLAEIGEIAVTVQEEQEKAKAECSNCTFDMNMQLGELLLRCEKLQEQVDTLESRQMAMRKHKMLRNWGQDTDLMEPKDATAVQMQRDYEELTFIAGSLQKDSEQKQKAIETLFQSLEKLQKEKADAQDMLAAMDLKADKAALGSKVNCSQFEENMERLDERMQDLQSQISGQKQHWNQVQQQFSKAMEEKLDRLELKAFRNQMEEMWNRSIEELKNKTMESDSGAGIKKQLPVPFTCLSCDRTLTMQVPGQYPETLPCLQPLHSQRRPVVHGSVPRAPQNFGDHQRNRSTLPPIQGGPRTRALLQGPVTLPKNVAMIKPTVTQLLGSSGNIFRSHNVQLPVVIRTQNEPGPAPSRDHWPDMAP